MGKYLGFVLGANDGKPVRKELGESAFRYMMIKPLSKDMVVYVSEDGKNRLMACDGEIVEYHSDNWNAWTGFSAVDNSDKIGMPYELTWFMYDYQVEKLSVIRPFWHTIEQSSSLKLSEVRNGDPMVYDLATGWHYYYDETWARVCGPFLRKRECRAHLIEYAKELDRPNTEVLPEDDGCDGCKAPTCEFCEQYNK